MAYKGKTETDPNKVILVIMKKKMTYSEYQKIMKNAKSKGWNIQGYELGFYNDNLKQHLKINKDENQKSQN
ncbi:MAG: hypothetical protein WBA59_03710 [Moheibacter sp.]